MANKTNLRKLLGGAAVAALTIGLAISPLSISGAFANSDNTNGNGANSAMTDQDLRNEIENGVGPAFDPATSVKNFFFNFDRDSYDDDDDYKNNRFNSRPMNLDDFLTSLRNGSRIVEAERSRNEIEIEYSDGWEEKIEYGRYELEAPNGRTIISRPATQRDFDRLNSAF